MKRRPATMLFYFAVALFIVSSISLIDRAFSSKSLMQELGEDVKKLRNEFLKGYNSDAIRKDSTKTKTLWNQKNSNNGHSSN